MTMYRSGTNRRQRGQYQENFCHRWHSTNVYWKSLSTAQISIGHMSRSTRDLPRVFLRQDFRRHGLEIRQARCCVGRVAMHCDELYQLQTQVFVAYVVVGTQGRVA